MESAVQAGNGPVTIWRPQPGPQTALLACPIFEVFYGGARGGGKTDGFLGDFASHADLYGDGAIGLMVRKERTRLIEAIERSRELYRPLGAQFHEQDKLWRFPNGARLRFAYLERDADAEAYQGHSYSRIYVEELTNFADPKPIMKLMATLRSAKGVPVGFRANGNPGGPGHTWVKDRYIDPAPKGWEVVKSEFVNPFTGERLLKERIYIPSRLTDNRYLGADYVGNLQLSGSAQLVRAWLEGDWDVVEGAYFDCWRGDKHVIKPFEIPRHWQRFRSLDWGSARPFSVGWWAVSDGEDVRFPRGALIRYREWYGSTGEPNVGLKLFAEDVAEGIKAREKDDLPASSVMSGVADPAIFAQDGGPSIADRMAQRKVYFSPADNKRLPGWDQVRARLVGIDDKPMLYVFDTCRDLIRTLPALQHDANKPEDVDSDGEDHAADEVRYACMSRPMVKDKPPEAKPRDRYARDRRSSGGSWATV